MEGPTGPDSSRLAIHPKAKDTAMRRRPWNLAHASIAIGMLLAALAVGPRSAAGPEPRRPANRLARETSPYLLLHAHNPVDWYPWGPEAFAKAKAENKPIFLSIGY